VASARKRYEDEGILLAMLEPEQVARAAWPNSWDYTPDADRARWVAEAAAYLETIRTLARGGA